MSLSKELRQGILPFRIVQSDEPLVARESLFSPTRWRRLRRELSRTAMKLPEVIDREQPAPGSGQAYWSSSFVIPLVLMLHGGGKKLEDMREIKAEMSLMVLLDIKDLPASSTMGDWLRRLGEHSRGLPGLGRVRKHGVDEVLKRHARTEYRLDVDATVIEAAKEAAQWTYKKEKGYRPLLGFLFEPSLIVADDFRDGNVPAQAGAVEFLELCQRMMPKGKRICRLIPGQRDEPLCCRPSACGGSP